ncbi:EAL domain-containing protein [Sporomusa malonica]|uniref:Diguanylate cyclase (GGDEF) domain-containing protein n=1 Tax=Sporomusa malonica TaxID=112901 RepID=A0A1W2DUD8_9FIRM|nr:GGDEF domain-containing phosphodiesterase [Sporomusa malonica]SMD01027.1 diguanylate cyclase (GGDEF) domain-containing protein [Sporomusa malonica]
MNLEDRRQGIFEVGNKSLFAFIIFYIVIFFLWIIFSQGNEKVKESGIAVLLFVSTLSVNFSLYRTYKNTTSDKPFWALLFLGYISFICGELILGYSQYILNIPPPNCCVDLLYSLSLILTIAAFISIVWRRRGVYTCFKLVVDIILLVVIIYSISSRYLTSYFDFYSYALPASFPIYLAYLIVYLGIINGIIKFYSSSIWFSKSVLNLFLLSYTLFIISDIAYLYFIVIQADYLVSWVYLLWGIGRLSLALAAIVHLDNVAIKKGTAIAGNLTSDLFPLSISYIFVVVLLVILSWELGEINSLSIGVLFCIIMIGIRQGLSLMENEKLLQSLQLINIELQNMLYTDYLTALPNRFQLLHDLGQMKNPCLVIINVENFRAINEFYGYQAGDSLIRDVAKKIVELAKPYSYTIYRLAGDEYAVLGDSQGVLLNEWAVSAYEGIEKTDFEILGQVHHPFVTFGIALTSDNPLEKAQMALQYARQHNLRIQVYNDELPIKKDYQNNLFWVQEVQDAIREDRIILYYQPIMNLVSSMPTKYEVLVRMLSRDGTVILPSCFLSIIKKTRLYPRLTEVIIKKAFIYFSNKSIDFSINLSAADISDAKVKTLIIKLLSTSNLANRVTFEFVESEEFEDPFELSLFVKEVQKYNAKIAIDDFGSGYSNFAYILTMGADYLKIDGSLIKEIVDSPSALAIVKTIVHFAKQLNIKTIAEFVSSEDIYNAARNIGIDEFQGYYIGKPAPYIFPIDDKLT